MECFENGIATLRCIPLFLGNTLYSAVYLASAVAVIFLIIGGIRFITSGGDQIKAGQAKKTITFAIIGLAIIIFSFVIIKVVATLTGVSCQAIGIRC